MISFIARSASGQSAGMMNPIRSREPDWDAFDLTAVCTSGDQFLGSSLNFECCRSFSRITGVVGATLTWGIDRRSFAVFSWISSSTSPGTMTMRGARTRVMHWRMADPSSGG